MRASRPLLGYMIAVSICQLKKHGIYAVLRQQLYMSSKRLMNYVPEMFKSSSSTTL